MLPSFELASGTFSTGVFGLAGYILMSLWLWGGSTVLTEDAGAEVLADNGDFLWLLASSSRILKDEPPLGGEQIGTAVDAMAIDDATIARKMLVKS